MSVCNDVCMYACMKTDKLENLSVCLYHLCMSPSVMFVCIYVARHARVHAYVFVHIYIYIYIYYIYI